MYALFPKIAKLISTITPVEILIHFYQQQPPNQSLCLQFLFLKCLLHLATYWFSKIYIDSHIVDFLPHWYSSCLYINLQVVGSESLGSTNRIYCYILETYYGIRTRGIRLEPHMESGTSLYLSKCKVHFLHKYATMIFYSLKVLQVSVLVRITPIL